MNKPRIAFLGLGLMGSGMAHRLVGAGFPVAVYNRNRDKAAPFAAAGATVAASPREAAMSANVTVEISGNVGLHGFKDRVVDDMHDTGR